LFTKSGRSALPGGRKACLAALRREGIVREAFTPVGRHGVISILEGAALRQARPALLLDRHGKNPLAVDFGIPLGRAISASDSTWSR
jgi:hypothetical protein